MSGGRVLGLLLAAMATLALTGCLGYDGGDNLIKGKSLFVEKCSSCHVLARANAAGVAGPNLDEAWQQANRDGLGRSTFAGVVEQQILYPNRKPSVDPGTGEELAPMPAKLVTGEDAKDVAAYVAATAAAGGKDEGRLATAGTAPRK